MVSQPHVGYIKTMQIRPKLFILIGFVLVLFGVVAPLFIVIKIIESTFWLNFLAFGAQVAGLMLGIIGAASYVGRGKG